MAPSRATVIPSSGTPRSPLRLASPPSRSNARPKKFVFDNVLLLIVVAILLLGLVMMTSASISIADKHMHEPLFFLERQINGVLLGVLLGIGASLALGKYQFIKLNPEIYFIDHLPVATEAFDILVTIAASIGIAAIATLYPSRQAARLYPIEAIRHE